MNALDMIKPKSKNRMIDLVSLSGFNTSKWADFKGKNPPTNPKYCYEWSFTQEDTAIILNMWHDECRIEGKNIILQANFQKDAKKYRENRKPIWAARADRMDDAIRMAQKYKLPIRVILLDGEKKDIRRLGAKPSKVQFRELDPEFWHIERYDAKNGDLKLCRGSGSIIFEDQFDLEPSGSESPERKESIGAHFKRDQRVRKWVLSRANGCCEYCGRKGFKTDRGSIYMETHHVVSLAEGGPDTVNNVIALCPNDHRQAHCGSDWEILKGKFQEILKVDASKYRMNCATRQLR